MPPLPTLATAKLRVPVVLGVPQLSAQRTRRLAELGLRAGGRVAVLHRTAGGGRIVGVGQTRIALDKQTLAAIPVLSEAPDLEPAFPSASSETAASA